MSNYYEQHYGDLYPGHIAKASDINQIQQNVADAIKNAIKDLTEGESWILGTNDQTDKDAFILTPESKRNGRYTDQMNIAEGSDRELLSFRETSYRQPIKLSRSSVYSVIVELQNKSEKPVPVTFELRDQEGNLIPGMKTILNLPKETTSPKPFEIVFDLVHWPTAHGLSPEDLENGNEQLTQKNTDEDTDEEGEDHSDEQKLENSTAGASIVYLFIEGLNRNKFIDVNTKQENGYEWTDGADPTFGIVVHKNSQYGQLLEESTGNEFRLLQQPRDLSFQEVYANSPTYKCNFGQAIIAGEKVVLADTHISVGGASTEGDVLSYIYMDTEGHLNFTNTDPFTGTEVPTTDTIGDHLHIANIMTYANDAKDPVIYQDDEDRIYRPRSHHERIRRLEKKMDYTQEIAIPPRLKYTLTGEDWIDTDPSTNLTNQFYQSIPAKDLDNLNKKGKEYFITTDENGNFIIKMSNAESFSVPITLKNQNSGKITTEKDKTKVISKAQTSKYINALEKDDLERAKVFAEMKDVVNDYKKGELTLSSTVNEIYVATNKKEAKETEFNPWDDSKANRPKDSKVKPIRRAYTVKKGEQSQYPAMTFYTKNGYVLKKLEIPIYKFKDCKGIKFFIYKRQGPNNKTNTVWLEKLVKATKPFSLKNAKIKKGYQYMDNGFLIDFTTKKNKKGLELPKGQYVIVCLPIPKSKEGTVYVETYKPKESKDFCIRYEGSSNASHFLLKDRYQEVWYNPVKAIKEDMVYSKKGEVVSGTVSWEHKEAIKTIKPYINAKIPKGTSVELYVDVGSGKWTRVYENKENKVIGSGTGESFRWKAILKSNSKETPVIKYNKNKKYAIRFDITRATPDSSKSGQSLELTKNLCFTGKPFNANEILREYIGDQNLAWDDNKFSNFEFARVWGTEGEEDSLLIDIAASDRIDPVQIMDSQNNYVQYKDDQQRDVYYPVYSLHYVDLHLKDFAQTSVDYSNYDAFIEDDEYNLRLKLDTENSYNDNDIRVIDPNSFVLTDDSYNAKTLPNVDEETGTKITISADSSVESGTKSLIVSGTLNTTGTVNYFIKKDSEQKYTTTSEVSNGAYTKTIEILSAWGTGDFTVYTTYVNSSNNKTITSDEITFTVSDSEITIKEEEESDEIDVSINLSKISNSDDSSQNQVLARARFANPIDLSKYTELRANLSIEGVAGGTLSGLGIYISSQYETDAPTMKPSEDYKNTAQVDGLPDLNSSQEEVIETYANQVIVKDYNNNGAGYSVYYKSVWNQKTNSWQWEQIHDVKSYNIYELTDRSGKTKSITLSKSQEDQSFFIPIDSDSVNLQFVKEIGIVLLKDQGKYSANNVNVVTLKDFIGVKQDYYPVFKAASKDVFKPISTINRPSLEVVKCLRSGSLQLGSTGYKNTVPASSSIKIKYADVSTSGEDLCSFDLTSKDTTGLNHIGVQIASDCLLTKHMLELHFRKVENGVETTIEKIKLPTLNYVYYPITANNTINLSQVFKKIRTSDRFDKVVLYATPKFTEYSKQLKKGLGEHITLYIGNISLYKAETIPIFHWVMRMKFYLDDADEVSREKIGIRKIGTILNYR